MNTPNKAIINLYTVVFVCKKSTVSVIIRSPFILPYSNVYPSERLFNQNFLR